jgi:hypothetical protein
LQPAAEISRGYFKGENIMTLIFGTLSVCGEYEGNLHTIAQALNNWNWEFDANGEVRFSVQNDRISTNADKREVAFPTTYPSVWWVDFKDGTRVRRDQANKALLSRHGWTERREFIELPTISGRICPLLTNGALELYSEASVGDVCWWERLTIRLGGVVERDGRFWGDSGKVKAMSDKFEPGNGPLSRLMRGEEGRPEKP